jgi:hypothetical protein
MDAKEICDIWDDHAKEVRSLMEDTADKIAKIFLPYCKDNAEIRALMTFVESLTISSFGLHLSYREMQRHIELTIEKEKTEGK